MNEFFNSIKEGLEEVVEYKKGKTTLRSKMVELPLPPYQYSPRDIKKIRKKANYSQSIFALILNVSVKTLQSWESGERKPSGLALRLLEIIDQGHYKPRLVSPTSKKQKPKKNLRPSA